MFTIHDPDEVIQEVVTRLAAQTGKNVGDGEATGDTTFPYAVVYQLDDELTDGTLGDPTAYTVWTIQVTSVGETAEQAGWMSDQVIAALEGFAPTTTAATCQRFWLDAAGAITRDDSLQTPLFMVADIFTAFQG